jgi:hypothetical protein
MIELFKWISAGGCEACDALSGCHAFEPERPHPNCRCEIEVTQIGMAEVLDFVDDILDFADEAELEDALDELDDDLALTAALGHGVPTPEERRRVRFEPWEERSDDHCPEDVEVKFVDATLIKDSDDKIVGYDVFVVATLTCTRNGREHDFSFEMTVPVDPTRILEFGAEEEAAEAEAERLKDSGAPLNPPRPHDFCAVTFQPEDPDDWS